MAIDANNFDPNDPKNQPGQATNLGPQGGIISGQAGSSGSATNPQAASNPTSSGMNYTGLNQYLNANDNAGQTMGNQLASQVNSGTTSAGNQAQNVYGQFNKDLSSATAFSNPNAVQKFIENPTGGDPSVAQQTKDTLGGRANYQAPVFNTESGYNTAASGVQNAKDQASQLQNSQGQYQLLNQYFGNPSYTQGQKNLDQALIGTSSGAQGAFNQAMKNAQNLGTQWNGYNTQAGANAQNAEETVGKNASDANAAINGAITNNQTSYGNTLTADNAAQTAAYQADQNLLKSMGQVPVPGSSAPTLIHSGGTAGTGGAYANPMTNAQVNANPQLSQLLSTLGASAGVDSVNQPGTQNPYTGYFGVNPNSFFTANSPLQTENVVTPQQQAQQNALQQMIGLNPQFSQANQAAAQYDPTATPGNFDRKGFDSAVQNAIGTFNQGLAPLQAATSGSPIQIQPGRMGTPGQAATSQATAYQNLNDYLNNYGLASVSNPGIT